jgi:hypothetical protein
MTTFTALVTALAAEKAAWAVAPSVQVATSRYPACGCRQYTGTLTKSVLAEIVTQVNTELAAANTALTNCMAGK